MTTEPFRNAHLSYSRLSRFEQCPLSYRLHYIEKRQAEPGLPLRFGKLVHAVLERLLPDRPPWRVFLDIDPAFDAVRARADFVRVARGGD